MDNQTRNNHFSFDFTTPAIDLALQLPTPSPINIHLKPTTPRLQLLSPFYSGVIPAEIRSLIFSYVLTPTPIPDTDYDPNTHYSRPGFTCRTQLHLSLLRTCRRIYLETYQLPPTSIPHIFWHARHPPSAKPPRSEHSYFRRLPNYQLALLKSLHLHTQLYWLQDFLRPLTSAHYLQTITHLKLTIRRGDWWWNERNEPLAINPYRGNADIPSMRDDMARSRRGEAPAWQAGKWGASLAGFPQLEVLEMEFETSEEKREELKMIAEWARTWEFPMGKRGVLSTRKHSHARAGDGSEKGELGDVKMWEWRGKMVHWSEVCPFCVGNACQRTEAAKGKNGDRCRERKGLMERGEGPMLVVMELKWKLRSLSVGEESSGLVEGEEDAQLVDLDVSSDDEDEMDWGEEDED
ncbi:uncharacterized protein EAF01_006397 [Botrytis porri]|uniref:uncharacterized protein n=1 Tax=Botrytis porri TaxID=87229 RepID=UPI0019019519|nr:uncharacterized protein EAF01_006397 [Botrytis porri]KAF7903348.1 hypothetical protein EAF01_006397 [Botrytis porri]